MRRIACAVVSVALLAAHSAARADVTLTGLLQTQDHTVAIDSVIWRIQLLPQPITHVTAGWGGPPRSSDSFDFPALTRQPSRASILYAVDSVRSLRFEVNPFAEDTWYALPDSQNPAGNPLVCFTERVGIAAPPAPVPGSCPQLRAEPTIVHGRTVLAFSLPAPTRIRLSISDMDGRRVRTLLTNGPAERRELVAWDCRDDAGRPVARGAYFAILQTSNVRLLAKLIVQR